MSQSKENSVEFLAGAPVGTPPAGTYSLHVDGSGNVKLLNSSGTDSSIGGGSGTVHTDATMTGDGSSGTPLHVVTQFGSDTTVNLLNSTPAPVAALELVASLTTNTAGSEVSKWVCNLLVNGAQVSAFVATGNAFQTPIGTIALPGMTFQGHTTNGFSYDVGTAGLFFSLGGAQFMGLLPGGSLRMHADASNIIMGTANQGFYGQNGLDAQVYSNLGNVEIGTDGAVATGSATLHLTIPSCAGTPTGTVVPKSGKVAIIYDTTANKLWASAGGGTWKSVALT